MLQVNSFLICNHHKEVNKGAIIFCLTVCLPFFYCSLVGWHGQVGQLAGSLAEWLHGQLFSWLDWLVGRLASGWLSRWMAAWLIV